jgi:ParB family chromosome partitioning protein
MAIPDSGTQIRVAGEIAANLLSVRETERLVAGIVERRGRRGRGKGRGRPADGPDDDPNVAAAQDRLIRALATKVRIVRHGARGRIEIDFHSDEELDRLFSILVSAEKGH